MLLSLTLITAHLEEPDRVHLVGGTVISGRIVAVETSGVSIELAPGTPPLKVQWAQIAAPGIETSRDVVLGLANGDRFAGRIVSAGADSVSLESQTFGTMAVPTASLPAEGAKLPTLDPSTAIPEGAITPPEPTEWKAFEDTDWTGKVRLAGTFTSGNVDSVAIDFLTEVQRQWERDRLSGRLRFRYGEVDNETSAEFGLVGAKFEHYLEPDLYLYANTEISRDNVQNLNFRALLGIGVGYLPWKPADNRFLALEAGITALYEDYDGRDSDLDPTLRLAVDYHDVFGERVTFFQTFEALFPLTDVARYVLRSSTGIGYALGENWSLNNRLDLVYLGDPPDDTKNLDVVLTVGIEYTF